VSQFATFATTIEPDGALVYFNGDKELCNIADNVRSDVRTLPYGGLTYTLDGDATVVTYNDADYRINLFGKHNMQNMHGAMLACQQIGIAPEEFLKAIETFSGAAKRLQKLKETPTSVAYLDFAHSPSKLKATTEAVRERYPKRKLVAVMELHTFSSLTKAFLPQYAHTMDAADVAYVYFNPEVVAHKRLEEFDVSAVEEAFCNSRLKVYTNSAALKEEILNIDYTDSVLLIMTSGNFSGIDIRELAEKAIK
jgi:UDP-N-acetylmuramate: L-alanyl-gamma-D-glutamyl-meso-diaminopimelate ligase